MGQIGSNLRVYGPTENHAILSLISTLDAKGYIITDSEYDHPYINVDGHGRYEVFTEKIPGEYHNRCLWVAWPELDVPECTSYLNS